MKLNVKLAFMYRVGIERSVIIDDSVFALVPQSHRYRYGANFRLWLTGFSSGWHRFHFRFSDGVATVASPIDSFYVTGSGLIADERAIGQRWYFSAAPNPFRNYTRIYASGEQAIVRDATGRIVNRLTGTAAHEGAVWNGRDCQGKELAAGVYFITVSGLPSGRVLTVVKLRKRSNGQ